MCKSHCGGYRLYLRAYRDKRRPLPSWSSILRYYPQRLEVEEAIADQRKEAARALSTAADCAVSRGAADAVRKCNCDSFCVLHDHRICDGDIRVPAYTWASTDVTILAVGVTLRFAGSYWQILQLDVIEPLKEFPRDGAGDDRNAFRGSACTDCFYRPSHWSRMPVLPHWSRLDVSLLLDLSALAEFDFRCFRNCGADRRRQRG